MYQVPDKTFAGIIFFLIGLYNSTDVLKINLRWLKTVSNTIWYGRLICRNLKAGVYWGQFAENFFDA